MNYTNRYKIIIGLGSALRYLHMEWDQCVLHGDIKPSNILLDDKFRPMISDIGLARFFPEDQTYLSTAFAGTL